MLGSYNPYSLDDRAGKHEGSEPIVVKPPKPPAADPRKARARQLTWKFFSSAQHAYQLDVTLQPIPASAGHLIKEQGAGHVAELLLNGVRVFLTATPAALRKAAEFSFQINAEELPELRHLTMTVRLEEDAKGKLGGVARLGKRTLRAPEYAAGEGIEPVRRLTWRFVHGHACYYLSYTVLHRFALSQIAINGFPLCVRKHSVFQQLPFKKAKYDVDIDEPGLGELYTHRLTLKAELMKDDVIDGVAAIDDTLLGPPKYFRGEANTILPLLQPCSQRSTQPISNQDHRLEELLGDAPQGWAPPQSAIKLQAAHKHRHAHHTPAPAPTPPAPQHARHSSHVGAHSGEIRPATSRRTIHFSPDLSPPELELEHEHRQSATLSAPAPHGSSLRRSHSGLESVPEGTTESQISGNEDGLSAQASAELAFMSGQGPSQQTMQLEDTQVLAALAQLDSFGTSSDDLVSEPSGELARQLSGEAMARQRSAEARRKRRQAAAHVANLRSASDELLQDVEAATNQVATDLSLLSPPSNKASSKGPIAPATPLPALEMQRAHSGDSERHHEAKRKEVSAALVRVLTGASETSHGEILATPPQSSREAPITIKSDIRSSEHSRSGTLSDHEDDAYLPGEARAKVAGWMPAEWTDASGTSRTNGSSGAGEQEPGAYDTADMNRASMDSSLIGGSDLHVMQLDEVLSADLEGQGHARPLSPERLAGAVASPAQALEAAKTKDPAHWCLDRNEIQIARTANGKKMRIGEGSSGTVYKALMHGCDEVAVKLVKTPTPTEQERDGFYREVLMLHALRHKNVVQFYGACLESSCFLIVTELMTGGDLYTAIRRCPDHIAWNRLGRRIAIDVALGLNYLHTRRPAWMHRDLKSPNILLTREGVAKIGDVGLMKAQVSTSMTAQSSWTPLWAAPEVIRHERATIKADIWSFGIIMWELASLSNIADYPSLGMACQMKGSHVLRLPKMCPPNAARVFYECTKPKPEDRPDIHSVVDWLREEDE